ncbi:MAG: MBL fold metallo-hydrolase [Nitrososphaerota archaeon]|jgi:ribonuclease BN (tRNA processing enzyme)|nr:MBL fold metallo-hydrolase [Nitrososphaerota archaeon]
MRAECQFAKAGQGLFYNGLLVDDKGKFFSFVYDCGTSNGATVLKDSITDYKELAGKRLDLLALSHFHQDHVSHIPELIKGLELGTVVIPFIRPETRLLIAAQYEDIENDTERIQFYNDPLMYFIAHGAERVVTAHSDEDNSNFFGNIESREYPNGNKEYRETVNQIVMSGHQINTQVTSCFMSKGDEYSGKFQAIIPHYQWEFRFKNVHYDKINNSLRNELSKLLEKHNNSFEEILRNKSYIRQLREIYKDNFEDNLNETSLVMLSRPLRQDGWFIGNSYCQINCKNKVSTFVLGDLTIGPEMFYYWFKNFLCSAPLVFQLPHHGANLKVHTSWCGWLKKIGQHCHNPISFVVSYGIKNRYGHPMLCNICSQDEKCYMPLMLEFVNERKDFCYTILY